jgi:hypothetical protein
MRSVNHNLSRTGLTLVSASIHTRGPLRHSTLSLVTIAGALAASGALFAQSRQATAPPNIMPIAEVRPGMRGYGLTVFRGTRPERFDIEVIDVLHNFRPHMDAVLIRTPHPVLDRSSSVAGMSGSPIYINDRLVGAYAYGWEFGREPIAGVTPIDAMLAEMRRPRRAPPGLIPGSQIPIQINPPSEARDARAAALGSFVTDPWGALTDRARERNAPVATPYGTLVPAATPLIVGGVGARALQRLTEAFEPFGILPVQAGGSSTTAPSSDTPAHFEDGGAIAVRMIQGDISGNITGTVTHVRGNQLVAFGHPMMDMGETAMPAALARVAWIMASERRSFKVSEAVRDLGAVVQDRPTTIVVDEQGSAPTIPVRVRIRGVDGAPHTDWNARVAAHRGWASRLAAVVLESALETTAADEGDVAWTVRSRVEVRGRGPVEFTEHGASASGLGGMGPPLAADFMARLMDNAFGVLPVDRVDFEVELHWARDFAWVRNVALTRAEVDPGQSVELRVNLSRYGEPGETRAVRVEIPRELAGRDVDIEVAAGNETFQDVAEPESMNDLIRNLTSRFPDDALVVTIKMPGQGVAVRGRVVQNLPSSALDLLRPGASTDGADPVSNFRRVVVPIGRVVVGRDRVRLRVREVRL